MSPVISQWSMVNSQWSIINTLSSIPYPVSRILYPYPVSLSKNRAMSKAQKSKNIITEASYGFLKNYINNASPTGFESSGQKLWMNYIKPYADEMFTDAYGTAVAVVNPSASFKVVIE